MANGHQYAEAIGPILEDVREALGCPPLPFYILPDSHDLFLVVHKQNSVMQTIITTF